MKRCLFAFGFMLSAANYALAQAPYGSFAWTEPHHSATVDESRGRGLGRAAQMGNAQVYLSHGLAEESRERANRLRIENQLAVIEARYRVYQIKHEMRNLQQPAATPDEIFQLQRKLGPRRLSALELNESGQINWPAALQTREYLDCRLALDKLFRLRATSSTSMNPALLQRAIENETKDFRAKLVHRINEYSVSEFITARGFLDSLQYEARFNPSLAMQTSLEPNRLVNGGSPELLNRTSPGYAF